MDYTHLLEELKTATAFDLHRLHMAIGNELEDPKRILSIRQKLRIGMEINYFYYLENRLIKAKLLEMKQKNVVILDHEQNRRFAIPYYMLNVDNIDVEIYESEKTGELTANNLKVGDCVGFNNDGESIVGIIKRINHKTVTLKTNMGNQWRVAYAHLYKIHDAQITTNAISAQNSTEE